MKNEVEIRRLGEGDLESYRELRVRGFREHQEAFTSSADEEEASPIDGLRRRLGLDEKAKDDFVVGAFVEGKLVGATGVELKPRRKESHKAHLYGVIVVREMAGQGIGRKLLEAALREAAKVEGLEQIQLTVSSDILAAVKLYESVGFVKYGVEKNAIKVDGKYVDKTMYVRGI